MSTKGEFWRKSNAQERVQLIQQITMEVPDFLAIVETILCVPFVRNWTADTLATPLYDACVGLPAPKESMILRDGAASSSEALLLPLYTSRVCHWA